MRRRRSPECRSASKIGPRSLPVDRDVAHTRRMQFGDVVHQCPFCELRFAYMAEVKDHVIHDHPARAEGFAGTQTTELPHG